MKEEARRRSPRIPLTAEEVAQLVEIKKIREHNKLIKFKKSFNYKFLNCFNVFCFFIFCELIISFYGPCYYQTHITKNILLSFSNKLDKRGQRTISELVLIDIDGKSYTLIVNDFIEPPAKFSVFKVGKDYLLQLELKAFVSTSDNYYRIQTASPILFLSVFLGIFSVIFFSYNLNQNQNSLFGLSAINFITIITFLVIS